MRHSGIARFVLFERPLDVGHLPGVQLDIGLDCLARQIRFAAFGIASQHFETLTDLTLEPYGHRGAFCHATTSLYSLQTPYSTSEHEQASFPRVACPLRS